MLDLCESGASASKRSLNLILPATGNQWSWFSAGVTWSRRRRLSTKRAAAFWTRCSGTKVDGAVVGLKAQSHRQTEQCLWCSHYEWLCNWNCMITVQLKWALSQPIGCYHLYLLLPFIIYYYLVKRWCLYWTPSVNRVRCNLNTASQLLCVIRVGMSSVVVYELNFTVWCML